MSENAIYKLLTDQLDLRNNEYIVVNSINISTKWVNWSNSTIVTTLKDFFFFKRNVLQSFIILNYNSQLFYYDSLMSLNLKILYLSHSIKLITADFSSIASHFSQFLHTS